MERFNDVSNWWTLGIHLPEYSVYFVISVKLATNLAFEFERSLSIVRPHKLYVGCRYCRSLNTLNKLDVCVISAFNKDTSEFEESEFVYSFNRALFVMPPCRRNWVMCIYHAVWISVLKCRCIRLLITITIYEGSNANGAVRTTK